MQAGRQNVNETATIIAAEAYTALILSLVVAFGGYAGTRSALRLRMVPARAYAIALALMVAVVATTSLAYILAGADTTLRDSYMRIGTDGGRLGLLEPITTLSVGVNLSRWNYRGRVQGFKNSQHSQTSVHQQSQRSTGKRQALSFTP
jgi:hypothetical protein